MGSHSIGDGPLFERGKCKNSVMESPPPLIDALGTVHLRANPGARIVSLVPSITELLIDLGLHNQVVGRTGFCIHPKGAVQRIAKIGGTKDVNIEKIRTLAPTHVIVNVDENQSPTVDALRTFVPHIVVTHPQTPQDNITLYRLLGGLFGAQDQAQQMVSAFDAALSALQAQRFAPQRVLYVIWQDPWMTVARDTYISQMLALVNWHTWPNERGGALGAARYPVFAWADALLREIDLILLSSEPYRFNEAHVDALEKQTGKPVLLIDGEMTSWYGSRAITGLRYLGEFASRA
jgi:ABC-type Fe3+-hydroxamate transport system substrate-binding protein